MSEQETRDLITEAVEGHEPSDSHPGEAPICLMCSPLKYPCDVVRLAGALEATLVNDGWEYRYHLVDEEGRDTFERGGWRSTRPEAEAEAQQRVDEESPGLGVLIVARVKRAGARGE